MSRKKGGRIVCTPTRIINAGKTIKSIPREQVTKNITRYGWEKKLSAIIELTTGKSYYIKHWWWRKGFEADKILINTMKNMNELEKIIISHTS